MIVNFAAHSLKDICDLLFYQHTPYQSMAVLYFIKNVIIAVLKMSCKVKLRV